MRLPMLDMLLAPFQQSAAEAAKSSLTIPIDGVRLVDFCGTDRFRLLDKQESYFRRQQHAAKLYTWDGHFMGYGDEVSIAPGYDVPYAKRRPLAKYDAASMIVHKLTALLFGSDKFPEINVPGDTDAEDYVKALIRASRLPMRLIEARNLGGATGTACLSFAFSKGKPRISTHNAKHVTVLEWEDESERRPARVLLSYVYKRQVWDPSAKRIKAVDYFFARYWDQNREVIWSPIPRSLAETTQWTSAPSEEVQHNFGFCPFYWIQNYADSEEPDGVGDYEGLEDKFDQVDELLSASTKGTKANVDPTLIVMMDPRRNDGSLRKGSNNAIFSEGGAEYLELKGHATKSAKEQIELLLQAAFDAAGVVNVSPEKLSGAAQSAAALRILFAPMLARCDLLREQYGEFGIKVIVLDMLRACRTIEQLPPVAMEDGSLVRSQVILPPRVVDGVATARVPGTSEDIELNWPPYFPPTWEDISKATTATQAATGGKPIISQRTGIAAVQSLFGVQDVDAEMDAMKEDAKAAMEETMQMMSEEGPQPALSKGAVLGEDEEDDDLEDDD